MSEDSTYTTSRGVTVEFLAIMPDLEAFGSAHKDPDPPTYEARPGVRFAYDEKSIQDETTSEDDKAKWQEYLSVKTKATEKAGRDMIKLCLLKGIKAVLPITFDVWRDEQEFIGIPLEGSPLEQRFKYLYSQIIGNVNDILQIIRGVSIASGQIPQELTAQAEATFPGNVGQRAVDEPSHQAEQMAVEQPLRASAVRKQNRRAAE